MKHVLFTFALIGIFSGLFSQNDSKKGINSGTITYEQVMKMDIKLEGDASEFEHLIPKERKSKKILYFNNQASLFKNLKEEKKDDIGDMEAEGMIIRMEEPDNILFSDFESKKRVEQKEFMTRVFLIESEVSSKGWKITGNQKNILGYNCQEAVKNTEDKKMSVWFTPEISISAGPGSVNGLPGLVLEVNIDDGKLTVKAIEINEETIDKTVLVKPNKGKKVTEEEFKTIVDEKMKEMGAEGGSGSGKFIIKIKQ